MIDAAPADRQTHETAAKLARQCRFIIQACLREEEWRDADLEFYRVIRAGLEEFASSKHSEPSVKQEV